MNGADLAVLVVPFLDGSSNRVEAGTDLEEAALIHFCVVSALVDFSDTQRSTTSSRDHLTPPAFTRISNRLVSIFSDGRIPDGVTSFPFKCGKALAWDASCTESFSANNLYTIILNHDSASSAAEDLRRKYPILAADVDFFQVTAGCSLLADIGLRTSRATNDPRQTSYVFQQISIVIIRGNALSMTSSLRRYNNNNNNGYF